MPQPAQRLILAALLLGVLFAPSNAAEREDVRKVINLVTSVKMPYPESLKKQSMSGSTARVRRPGDVRLDERRWCYEHIPPLGACNRVLLAQHEARRTVSAQLSKDV
jgi:hypothetical protein